MFILFGNKVTQHKIAKTKVCKCGRCNNVNAWDVIKVIKWFTIFFIPLIPYSVKYYEKCPICSGYSEISKEQADLYAKSSF